MTMQCRWERHRGRIAFQLSGGRDSTAALYLLRARWLEMTVYHLDTGDQFPEMREVVRRVRAEFEEAGGRFEVIATDVNAYREHVAWGSDVVPTGATPIGHFVTGRTVRLVDRYECCWANLMGPMQARMATDGITLIVRGTRDDEFVTPVLRDGEAAAGFEVHYPIGGWNGEQVSEYLRSNGLPMAPFYEQGLKRAPECMQCTAWLDEGRLGYLKRNHPGVHAQVRERLALIDAEVGRAVHWLKHELEA